MNKNDLIGQVADAGGLSRGDAGRLVAQVLGTITEALQRGEPVRLTGFGTFTVSTRKASSGRNPRTGAPMNIKALAQPKFRAGKALKDALN